MSTQNAKLKVIYPYYNTDDETIIELAPDQLKKGFIEEVRNTLNSKLKGKCNNFGYIKSINRILNDSIDEQVVIDNYIPNGDFSGKVTCKVKFNANICIPKKDDIYIAEITKIHFSMIIAKYDSIKIVIDTINNFNNTNFKQDTKTSRLVSKKTGKFLNTGDNIYIRVIEKQIKRGSPDIVIFASLEQVL